MTERIHLNIVTVIMLYSTQVLKVYRTPGPTACLEYTSDMLYILLLSVSTENCNEFCVSKWDTKRDTKSLVTEEN